MSQHNVSPPGMRKLWNHGAKDMSAPGGGAAKADAAISRQKLMNRFLMTMPVFPSQFGTRRLAVFWPASCAASTGSKMCPILSRAGAF